MNTENQIARNEIEIGSEYWLSYNECVEGRDNRKYISNKYGDVIYTSSGRSAILKVIQENKQSTKTALLPSYICDSVIQPFISAGIKCDYYEIDDNFQIDLTTINYKEYDFFLHLGYFGFQTNFNITDLVSTLRENGTIIIEDVTHSLFSNHKIDETTNDYYVASLRKWMGLPSGGFISSKRLSIPERNDFEQYEVVKLRTSALTKKRDYVINGDNQLKEEFVQEFAEAEEILNKQNGIFEIDEKSLKIFTYYNLQKLIQNRINNYSTLLNAFKTSSRIQPVFKEIPNGVCPLFFSVYIDKDRDKVRDLLIKQKVYCPIHWPISDQSRQSSNKRKVNSILSIPCDQRYNETDMNRIITILKSSLS